MVKAQSMLFSMITRTRSKHLFLYTKSTFDEKWIYSAKKLADYVIAHFKENESDFFFYNPQILMNL